jgi:hypothetical protein
VQPHAHPPLGVRANDRPALEVADIVRAHGDAFVRAHVLLPEQHAVLRAIARCRTAALGGHLEVCDSCSYSRPAYNSCRNRHCPKCQALTQARWIERRMERVLPTHAFHVVFTLPSELRGLVMGNREKLFNMLLASAAESLLELGRDPKWLGAELGVTSVLHTWTRALLFHPHVHCIVTGGGLSLDGQRWIAARPNFLFPVRVLGALFRGKFLAATIADLARLRSEWLRCHVEARRALAGDGRNTAPGRAARRSRRRDGDGHGARLCRRRSAVSDPDRMTARAPTARTSSSAGPSAAACAATYCRASWSAARLPGETISPRTTRAAGRRCQRARIQRHRGCDDNECDTGTAGAAAARSTCPPASPAPAARRATEATGSGGRLVKASPTASAALRRSGRLAHCTCPPKIAPSQGSESARGGTPGPTSSRRTRSTGSPGSTKHEEGRTADSLMRTNASIA